MAVQPQLAATGGSSKSRISLFFLPLFVAIFFVGQGHAQDRNAEQARLAAAKGAFDAGHWDEAAQLSQGPADQSPELDLLRGLAFARLEKWDQAKLAFEAGARKSPLDSRFRVELAGVAYKEKDFPAA